MRRFLTKPILGGVAVLALLAGGGAYALFAGSPTPVPAASTPSPSATPSPTARILSPSTKLGTCMSKDRFSLNTGAGTPILSAERPVW